MPSGVRYITASCDGGYNGAVLPWTASVRRAVIAMALFAGGCAGADTGAPAAAPQSAALPSTSPAAIVPVAPRAAPSGIKLDPERSADDITFSLNTPVRRGGTAIAIGRTAPNAQCTIAVRYEPAPVAAGLDAKAADGSGSVSWSWTVDARTSPGSWPIEVTCVLVSGQRTVARETLVVE